MSSENNVSPTFQEDVDVANFMLGNRFYDKSCEMCGSDGTWTVTISPGAGYTAVIPTEPRYPNPPLHLDQQLRPKSLKLVTMICGNCGFIRLFSRDVIAGTIRKQKESGHGR